jgi:hypothetical protein
MAPWIARSNVLSTSVHSLLIVTVTGPNIPSIVPTTGLSARALPVIKPKHPRDTLTHGKTRQRHKCGCRRTQHLDFPCHDPEIQNTLNGVKSCILHPSPGGREHVVRDYDRHQENTRHHKIVHGAAHLATVVRVAVRGQGRQLKHAQCIDRGVPSSSERDASRAEPSGMVSIRTGMLHQPQP